jgi:hypothetical protein
MIGARSPADRAPPALQHLDRACHLDQVHSVDDADAAALGAAVDRLRVFQLRIEARGGIDKPRAQVGEGMVGEALVAGDLPGGHQFRCLDREAQQGAPVRDEVIRVAQAVALDIRSAGMGWVRPPVVAFRIKIMETAAAARCGKSGDRLRSLAQVGLRGAQDARAVEAREVGRSVGERGVLARLRSCRHASGEQRYRQQGPGKMHRSPVIL